jgi:uncharacterized protein with ParB-like and HNH nuclease domain
MISKYIKGDKSLLQISDIDIRYKHLHVYVTFIKGCQKKNQPSFTLKHTARNGLENERGF